MLNNLKLFFCLFFGLSILHSAQAQQQPNIIYVLADDLGFGDLSSFNPDGKINTPHLDALAADGMMFTDAHTSSAVCTPTRYGILTGRYNWRSRIKSGVLWGKSKALIPTERTTVASMLQDQGYHTAFVGKWHLGWNWTMDEEENIDFSQPVTHNPNDLGFDYAYGHAASLDIPPYVYVENGMPTAIPRDSTENTDYQGFWRKGLTAPDFVHEEVTPHFFDKAMSYVEERSQSGQPFFLYLPLPSPHTPILPLEEWQGKSGLNPYADFVLMIDDYVGQLMETVEQAGIVDNTMIIFTSDNGCSPRAEFDELTAKGHDPSYVFRGHKADIYEGGHRVPFIVRWPSVVPAGSRSGQVICTTDLMATCAEIVGYSLKDNEAEDSYSLMPLLKGEEMQVPLREATVHHSINGSFAIRQGDWKLIMCPGSGGWSDPRPDSEGIDQLPDIQLYNLAQDISETNNLQATHPYKVRQLKNLLTRYIVRGRSTPGVPQLNETDNRARLWNQVWWLSTN